jgi:DNA-binding CsgD family transcriptional regulator
LAPPPLIPTPVLAAAKRVALSQREGQLITLLSRGLKNKEIAFILQITEGTVKVYLSHLFQKVGVKDRFELALFGLKNLTAGHAQPSGKPSLLTNAPIPHLRPLVAGEAGKPDDRSPAGGRIPARASHLRPGEI